MIGTGHAFSGNYFSHAYSTNSIFINILIVYKVDYYLSFVHDTLILLCKLMIDIGRYVVIIINSRSTITSTV